MNETYLLITRFPGGEIKSSAPLQDKQHAVLTAEKFLTGFRVEDHTTARYFATAFDQKPVGTVWGHAAGYDFRILRADYTSNGVAITPGLRVLDYDREWGNVEPLQFMDDGCMSPGGQFFDGWYLVHRDGENYATRKFNGERLTTKESS